MLTTRVWAGFGVGVGWESGGWRLGGDWVSIGCRLGVGWCGDGGQTGHQERVRGCAGGSAPGLLAGWRLFRGLRPRAPRPMPIPAVTFPGQRQQMWRSYIGTSWGYTEDTRNKARGGEVELPRVGQSLQWDLVPLARMGAAAGGGCFRVGVGTLAWARGRALSECAKSAAAPGALPRAPRPSVRGCVTGRAPGLLAGRRLRRGLRPWPPSPS